MEENDKVTTGSVTGVEIVCAKSGLESLIEIELTHKKSPEASLLDHAQVVFLKAALTPARHLKVRVHRLLKNSAPESTSILNELSSGFT